MNIWHNIGLSGQSYICPIKPRTGENPRFWKDSPAHKGVFAHAKDIIIPDPRILSLPVYAPADGVITELVQHYTQWGQTSYYLPFLNRLTVQTIVDGEFYQLCHIGANSCLCKIGDNVKAGQQIAETGVNGYMIDPRHIHILVGMYTSRNKFGFESLRIRWIRTTV